MIGGISPRWHHAFAALQKSRGETSPASTIRAVGVPTKSSMFLQIRVHDLQGIPGMIFEPPGLGIHGIEICLTALLSLFRRDGACKYLHLHLRSCGAGRIECLLLLDSD